MYKVPGLYIENNSYFNHSVAFDNNFITAFIGITEKGPINKAIRIKSFNQFVEIFGGFTDYSYLPFSVNGYFNCGGKECAVIRIVHEENGISTSLKSKLIVNEINNREMFTIEALSCGSWGNNIGINLRYSNSLDLRKNQKKDLKINDIKIYFNIKYGDKTENFLNLSINPDHNDYFVQVINARSKFIKIKKQTDKICIPVEIFNKYLSKGSNGLIDLNEEDFIGRIKDYNNKTGLRIIENLDDVMLIVMPDVLSLYNKITDKNKAIEIINKIYKAAIEICEIKKDKIIIIDLPPVDDLNVLLKKIKDFNSKFACLFFPFIVIFNPLDKIKQSLIEIPCSAHAAGLISNYINNIKYNDSFSNKFLNQAVGINNRINSNDLKLLNEHGINSLKYIPVNGVKLWGLRTLSNKKSFRYISDTINMIKIKKALHKGLQWILFENISKILIKKIKRELSAFFQKLWLKGMLAGSKPKDAFYMICNENNNTIEDYENGIINIEIGVALTKPAEFVVINIRSNKEKIDIFDF